MIPWYAGAHQRNVRRIESYSQTGSSGVATGTQVPLGDDQAGEAASNTEASDYMRIVPGRAVNRRDPKAYQRAGACSQRESVGLIAIVVVALDQETIAGHHPENSPDSGRCREVGVGRMPAQECNAGTRTERG